MARLARDYWSLGGYRIVIYVAAAARAHSAHSQPRSPRSKPPHTQPRSHDLRIRSFDHVHHHAFILHKLLLAAWTPSSITPQSAVTVLSLYILYYPTPTSSHGVPDVLETSVRRTAGYRCFSSLL
jgi:hypothetical protein